MKKVTPEGQLTRSIRSLLQSAGCFHWKNWGGPFGSTGISDILGIWKGRMLAIEVKAPAGRITEAQERFLQNVKDNGGIAFVARSLEDVIEGLELQDRFLIRTGR